MLKWLAPIMSFTAEEAFARYPGADASMHLTSFPEIPRAWNDPAISTPSGTVREVRRVVTAALELERAAKRIGSSLEAAPVVHVTDAELRGALEGVDLAQVCITSGIEVIAGPLPSDAVVASDASASA